MGSLFPYGLDLIAGMGLGLALALQLLIWLDPKGDLMSAPSNPNAELTQALTDAISATATANAAADSLKQARRIWNSATTDHQAKRKALNDILDKHLTPADPN